MSPSIDFSNVKSFLSDDVLANHNLEIKTKGDFKEKHPHYRDYFVDLSYFFSYSFIQFLTVPKFLRDVPVFL